MARRIGMALNNRDALRHNLLLVSGNSGSTPQDPIAVLAGSVLCRVWLRETSASKPLMTCRKLIDDVETGGRSSTRDESGGCPDYGPDGIRHEGGVTLNRALARNVGTCRPVAKGAIQAGGPREDWSTDAGHRGGAARSSDEGSVMELE